ncbi:MAG: PLDc N-terminal domain-containing protein [Gammaproteobacteria bacterium]|nr:PLDc N-terminal domain-containing protein [Gammaproteobacteria bacterium]
MLAGLLHFLLAIVASVHILLTKADVRAAIAWTGLVWLAPVFGPVSYLLFGINRIRRAVGRMREVRDSHTAEHPASVRQAQEERVGERLPAGWQSLAKLTDRVSVEPLEDGNHIESLLDGDAAYPAMLAAIAGASRSISLTTYIFDRGVVAAEFVAALAAAVARGVEVRVLVDGLGARYSRPTILAELRRHRIRTASFLPVRLPVPNPYSNLRNHRKILVVDGELAFTGGLNIRDACVLARPSSFPTRDLHFRLRGPVVLHLQDTFVFDWRFATGEHLVGENWFPPARRAGAMLARGIADGPDETRDALLLTLLGALATATATVRIVTPYFLPDPPLIDALRVTAMRGVRVEILIPARGNLRLVQWAQMAQLKPVLRGGCHVFLTRAPFDHSKLMVVDGQWSLIGSANWDPRSLRLNFEHVVECYSSAFATALEGIVDAKLEGAQALGVQDLEARALWRKLRDGAAWLMQPYL